MRRIVLWFIHVVFGAQSVKKSVFIINDWKIETGLDNSKCKTRMHNETTSFILTKLFGIFVLPKKIFPEKEIKIGMGNFF